MAALGKACTLVPVRHLNANRAAVAGLGRNVYLRTYPTVLVMPDGSTVNIRYKEPRRIIKLPADLSAMSEEDRQNRLNKRRPKKKVVVEQELEDSFNADSYSHFWK